MEDKSYSWLLSQLHLRKVPIKFLETGFCRGLKLMNWFHLDSSGFIELKPIKETSRTKFLLNTFLNQRAPFLGEYNPEKVICYLYHRKGIKIITAKDALELAKNQLHGLQVRSIHMALTSTPNYHKVYRIASWNDNGELHNSLTYGKFSKENNEEVKDQVMCERALSLTMFLSDFMYKTCAKFIKSMKIDLTVDSSGQLYIIKVRELQITDESAKSDTMLRGAIRHATLKALEPQSEEVSLDEAQENYVPLKIIHEKEHRRKDNNYKINLRKVAPTNSNTFLEMIAKTFDRERKAQQRAEMMTSKKNELEGNAEVNRRRLFQQKSLKSFKDQLSKQQNFNSINDLLYYVEKTRPRVWLKDSFGSEDQLCSNNFAATAKSSDKKPYHEVSDSDVNNRKASPTIQASVSSSSFRNQYRQNFLSFLSDEEKRLKSKLHTDPLKSPLKRNINLGAVLIGRKSVLPSKLTLS